MKALWTLLMVICLGLPFGEAWAMPIQQVQVTVTSAGQPLSKALESRMVASLQIVGDKVLVGRDVDDVGSRLGQYEVLTKDITSRVLYGYDVESLRISPGPKTALAVKVIPYGPVIEHIQLQVDYGNISPLGKSLLEPEVARITPQIEHMLLGAPLNSIDWVTTVAESELRSRIHDILPNFVAQVAIEPGPNTKVLLYIIPQGDVVRHVATTVDSESLPGAIFYSIRQDFTNRINGLQGLPVTFVASERPRLEAALTKALGETSAARRFGIDFSTELLVGTHTELRIHANSSRIHIGGEARIDMGHRDNNVSFLIHGGYDITARDEIYLETLFYPGTYTWAWYPSYMHRFSKDLRGGYQYEVNGQEHHIWLRGTVAPGWHVKGDRNLTTHVNTYSVLYDAGKHIQLEYLFQKNQNWLRLVGRM